MLVTFDLSFAGSFPTSADGNGLGRGMPDLGLDGEVGPRMHVRLLGNRVHFLRFSMAERAAFSTNFKRGDYRGLVLSPSLTARHENLIFIGSRCPRAYHRNLRHGNDRIFVHGRARVCDRNAA